MAFLFCPREPHPPSQQATEALLLVVGPKAVNNGNLYIFEWVLTHTESTDLERKAAKEVIQRLRNKKSFK